MYLNTSELCDAHLLRYCLEQAIPIYRGRVDRTLVVASLLASGHRFPDDTDAGEILAA